MPIDPVALLCGLVEIYSPSHQERRASEYLAAQMGAAGFDSAFVDAADNAVGILGDGPRECILLGHIDTVPGYIPPRLEDGKLYGRGSVDAKGSLAAFVSAAAIAGRQPGWRIIVIGATEEEATTSKGARHALTLYKPSLVVIGEPSRWDRITLGYKGRVVLDYRFTRPISHTARPEPNALETAVAFWNAVCADVAAFNEGRERAFDQLFSTLRHIHSEDDGFYETSYMTLSFRLPPDLTPDQLKARLSVYANGAQLSYRGEELTYRAEKNTSLVRAFNNAIRDEGGKPGFVYKTGTSDMNVVGPVWQCPIVAYGPGDSALDHAPDEHIEIAEYERAVRVLVRVLKSLGER
ncbi:MAG: [LysW]-lysine hydrolase [Chloroflexi bacterium]|jgi:LysW-gamma-L-lysine carboxypeptidase|nr:[LysW]-lysine hydrolase [Chloroflexota bacterium]